MITKENLFVELKSFNLNELAPELRETIDLIRKETNNGMDWMALKSESFRFITETLIDRLNAIRRDERPSPKSSPNFQKQEYTKTKEEKPAIPAKQDTKSKKENKPILPITKKVESEVVKTGLVERIPDEIRFIRRFINLDGKTKSKDDLRSFIASLQRAILEKRIRKTSPYAEQIKYIQEKLVKTFNQMTRPLKISVDKKTLESFREIVSLEKIMPSISLIKRYIGLNGKLGVKGRAAILLSAMNRAFDKGLIKPSDAYYKIYDRMHKNLNNYIGNKSQKTLSIEKAELNGLNGVIGCACLDNDEQDVDVIKPYVAAQPGSVVMTVEEARNKQYKVVNITGAWLELIGKFCLPTQFFVYGGGGSGKTSFVLLFTQYLSTLGYRILYIAGEQFDTPTFTELLNRLNIKAGNNYDIVGRVETLNPADYDFVVLDTKDSLELEVEEFGDIRRQYPEQSFIVIPHATKTGKFKGKEQWRNIMDVMIEGNLGLIKTGHDKNRWGGAGEMRVYEPKVKRAIHKTVSIPQSFFKSGN